MFSLLLLPLSLCLGSFVFVVNFCRIFQLFWLCCCCCCCWCLTLLLLLLFYCLSLTRCCLRRSQRILNVCQRCRFVQRYLLQTGVWGPGRALRIGSMCYARLFNRYWLPAVDTDWRPLPFAIAVAAPLTSSSLPYAVRLASLASPHARDRARARARERAFTESVFVLVLGALCQPACFGIELSSAELNWVRSCCCCSCFCLCHDRVLMLRAPAVAAPPTHCNPKQRQRNKTTTTTSSSSNANGDWRAQSSGGVDFLLPG